MTVSADTPTEPGDAAGPSAAQQRGRRLGGAYKSDAFRRMVDSADEVEARRFEDELLAIDEARHSADEVEARRFEDELLAIDEARHGGL